MSKSLKEETEFKYSHSKPNDGVKEQLRRLMDNANDDRVKEELRRMIETF